MSRSTAGQPDTADAPDRQHDRDEVAVAAESGNSSAPERTGAGDDYAPAEESSAAEVATYLSAGLARLPGISAALKRRAWVWCLAALAGLVIGTGLYLVHPPAAKATASVLITNDPNEDAGSAVLNAVAMAQTNAVAGLAVRRLGLAESPSSFKAASTVTFVSDRVLLITVSAPSPGAAAARANAMARAFLQFRAEQLKSQQQLTLEGLDLQIIQAKQRAASIAQRIAATSAQPPSPARQAELNTLQAQQREAASALTGLEQATANYQVTSQATAASMIEGSEVLDAAVALPRSHLKYPMLYAVGGLIAGLVVGLAVVIIGALASDRLRLRDDVADALGAPVRLSAGKLRAGSRLPGRRGLAAGPRDASLRRIVAYLRGAVPASPGDAAALAVVAVDNEHAAARCLVSLAVSCAREGQKVIVADLSSGHAAARLMRVRRTGIRPVSVRGTSLIAVIPDRGDILPEGPAGGAPRQAGELAAAYHSADLLLTLATLDPELGAEYLATWASTAVVMVTAGRSSAARIYSTGEMLRLAGIPPASAVLIGADKTDETLGTPPTQQSSDGIALQDRLYVAPNGFAGPGGNAPAADAPQDRPS